MCLAYQNYNLPTIINIITSISVTGDVILHISLLTVECYQQSGGELSVFYFNLVLLTLLSSLLQFIQIKINILLPVLKNPNGPADTASIFPI